MRVGITGHQEIPARVEGYVRERMAKLLAGVSPLVGVTALAPGTDQLFASLVREQGGRLHVVLPARQYELSLKDGEARERFRTFLAQADEVETLDHDAPSDPAYMAAGRRVVELSDRLIAVWDGEEARGLGGTGDVVAYARERGVPVEVIWPAGASR